MKATKEQLTRYVREIGNGAHVLLPRNWIGDEVVVTRTPTPPVRQRILDLLEPHLDKIIGAYLYGSHVRGEARAESDVDILLITSDKLDLSHPAFEILSIREADLDAAFKSEPLLLHAILAEARPIINGALLESLQERFELTPRACRPFLSATRRIVGIARTALDIESQGAEPPISKEGLTYSLVLRLRGLFILRRLLGGESYTRREFESWLRTTLPDANVAALLETYSAEKRHVRRRTKVSYDDIRKALELLTKELAAVTIHGKAKTKT